MKIHKTVNPVAYENTYYLEGEKEPHRRRPWQPLGSHSSDNREDQQTDLRYSPDPRPL